MTTTNGIAKPRLSVSTWSLHRTLGAPPFYGVDQPIPTDDHGQGAATLLELPALIAAKKIKTLEICHFHLPSRDAVYLAELKAAIEAAEVELFTLLVDDGDLSHPEHGQRDRAWMEGWLEVAQALSSRCVRMIAGKQEPDADSLERSYQGLRYLSERAEARGLRLMTENWFAITSAPEYVETLLQRLEGRVGLCLDFGNWEGLDKYKQLAAIAAHAESCHTKAHFETPVALDEADYIRCLELTKAAGFKGPYTLIYDGPHDNEWRGLKQERALVRPYLV
ncbi:MAG: TIM barrel protein [Candidatus Latescibacteria bacterium]|nr:TIM barrel protein [Candidatus Latescibacterota bacterium]